MRIESREFVGLPGTLIPYVHIEMQDPLEVDALQLGERYGIYDPERQLWREARLLGRNISFRPAFTADMTFQLTGRIQRETAMKGVRIQVVHVSIASGHLTSYVRIRGRNGEKMLTSEVYVSKSGARRAGKRLLGIMPGAVLEEVSK